MPLCEAGADKEFFYRCVVVEELCHQVKQLQEKVNRLHSIRANKQEIDQLFSEMLQSRLRGLEPSFNPGHEES